MELHPEYRVVISMVAWGSYVQWDRNRLRRAFLRAYRQAPQAIRRQSRGYACVAETERAEAESDTTTADEQRSSAVRASRAYAVEDGKSASHERKEHRDEESREPNR
jgi:hypothetical protein